MTDLWWFPVVIALMTAVASGLGTEAVRRAAVRRSILDVPNARSSHATPTPRGGGLALVALVALGWAFMAVREGVEVLGLSLPALAVAAVSALDDVRTLTARTRFSVHFVSALVAVMALGGWRVVEAPVIGDVGLGWLVWPFAVIWMVGLTNAYNFMDGIDGIAGIQAVVAGVAWAALGFSLGPVGVGWTGALIAGAALGFLWLNWAPARIFMGDVGSAFLGCVFAGLALWAGDGRIPLAGLLFVWPFVFDAGLTFTRRLLRRENVFSAHRSHLYQRLVIAGMPHAITAWLYGILAVASSAAGIYWALSGSAVAAFVGFAVPIGVLLPLVHRYETHRHAEQTS